MHLWHVERQLAARPPMMFAEERVEGSEVSCQVGEELVVIVNQPQE